MHSFPVEMKLRDGTPVLIRCLEPGDGHLLEIGLEHLSPQSRYRRFFRPMTKLPEALLKRFTEIDHTSHEAVGALDMSSTEPDPLGVARYIRLDNDDTAAEVAVTVVDSHQGQGLGTILLACLACRAIENNFGGFVAVVLQDNSGMLELFKQLDAKIEMSGAGEVEVRIPIFRDATCYPNTPAGEVFRQTYSMLNRGD